MKLLRAATLSVADVGATAERYTHWFDMRVEERGALDSALAQSWAAPASAGQPFAVLRPASGMDVFVRLVQKPCPSGLPTACAATVGRPSSCACRTYLRPPRAWRTRRLP